MPSTDRRGAPGCWPGHDAWRVGPLDPADTTRLRDLASRASSPDAADRRTRPTRRGLCEDRGMSTEGSLSGRGVREAAGEMTRTLGPHTDRDWARRAGDLEWSCWTTAAHVAHDLLGYATQLTGRPDTRYLPLDLRVRDDAPPADVLTVVAASAGLLAAAIDTAPADARAWHWGPCDPPGFAAMGIAETLLHTYDITRGLAVAWQPPAALSAVVLRRLFPDAPAGDPPEVLLWMTGRTALGDRPRRTGWSWQAALR
ncbi:maleylpyruvate isomerase N-terminal domain-containing protein [Micromonospora sp. NPDC092111]|uniref:maleylpyruvate isomerase N-terminal domain-containing protein n=1 Tax=Micromonospora sp. NPDC092111 TaxID=3364289 RepID=UPI0037F4A04E